MAQVQAQQAPTSRSISGPFQAGLHTAFAFAIAACLVAAITSWSRGRRYVDGELREAQRLAGQERRAEPEATAP